MGLIEIIKHVNPVPVHDCGDILHPFDGWEKSKTGGDWISKFPEEFYENKEYLRLSFIAQNSWKSLERLNVNIEPFKKLVQYKCPYNEYIHYWCVPVVVLTKDIKLWTSRCTSQEPLKEKFFAQKEWMKKFYPIKTKNGLPFTKIQRALLGPGYTEGTMVYDGEGFLYDSILALDNGDFLGAKVWMWFNKS